MSRLFTSSLAVALTLVVALAASNAMAVVTPFVADGNKDIGQPGTDPVAVGSYSVSGNVHTVAGGGGDWWDWAERGHVAYKQMPAGEWRLETEIAPLPVNIPGSDPAVEHDYWVKAGVFIRNDVTMGGAGDERDVNAIMAALRSDRNASSFQWRPDASSNSWSNADNGGPNAPQKLAIQRRILGGIVPVVDGFVSYDGTNWRYVGQTVMNNLVSEPVAGLAVTAHNNDGRLLTATFTNPVITDPVTPEIAMRSLGFQAPWSGQAKWTVREVIDAGNPGNLQGTVDALNANAGGTGTRVQYDAPVINIFDSDSHGHMLLDSPFGVVTAGHRTQGNVDNIAMVARAKVAIPADGWYTFDVNSDDGFELAIDGKVVMQADYGKGASDVLGWAELPAGTHDVRLLYWEGGGGSSVEVLSAQGVKTGWDRGFNMIGNHAFSYQVPGFSGNVTIESTKPDAYYPGNRDQALQAIADGRAAGTNSTATADRVNHSDPQNGGGTYGGDLPFPNNTGADDNNFATLVTGELVIPAAGTYYLGFQSDDGAALQIPGQTWTQIVENWTGGGVIEGDWLKADVWTGNSHTIGEITLAAGTYPFQLVTYEGGGGSFVEMIGSTMKGYYEVILTGSGQTISYAEGLQLVPEPSTCVMLLSLGLIGLVGLIRRKAA